MNLLLLIGSKVRIKLKLTNKLNSTSILDKIIYSLPQWQLASERENDSLLKIHPSKSVEVIFIGVDPLQFIDPDEAFERTRTHTHTHT